MGGNLKKVLKKAKANVKCKMLNVKCEYYTLSIIHMRKI